MDRNGKRWEKERGKEKFTRRKMIRREERRTKRRRKRDRVIRDGKSEKTEQ